MIETAIIAVMVISLFIVTITDLRNREVPDIVTLWSTIIGIVLRFVMCIVEQTWTPIIYGGFGLVIIGTIGYAFYKWNVWGDGDAKLMVALGAMIGMSDGVFLLILSGVGIWYVGTILITGAILKKWFGYEPLKEMPFVPPIALSAIMFIIVKGGIIH